MVVQRILVIRRKALGDVLVTLPAVLRLAAAFPEAKLDLVIDRPFAPLLSRLASGLEVLAWPPDIRRPGGWWRRLRAGNYDLVCDYLGSPRTAMWTAWTGAPLRVGYDLRWRRWAYNVRVPRGRAGDYALREFAGESFLAPLRELGLTPGPWQPTARAAEPVGLGDGYRDWARSWRKRSQPRVGMVFSASWSAKAWQPAEACRLYRMLEEEGAAPLFISGPGDDELAAALRAGEPAAQFAPPTNLLELEDLLRSLDLFIGTDNGARHLAACVGIPTVTLFGPTDPRGWNPSGPEHVALSTGEPCSPCDLTVCPVPGHPCLTNLKAERVLEAAKRQWAPEGHP
jgi:ADP-heptose:LPS heptosyltransferase